MMSPCAKCDTFDVVVVGSGPAGCAAVLEAASAGLHALVLEAFPAYGGSGAWSGGGMCLVGTPAQRARGIVDSVEIAFSDWMRCGGNEADAVWARRYLEGTRSLDAWLRVLGLIWDDVLDEGDGSSVPRWHRPVGGGAELMRLLRASANGLRVEWRESALVTRLRVDRGGAVTGVAVEADEGPYDVHASSVVVATGGFANNPHMLRRFGPDVGPGSRLLCGGAPQALGIGHALLEEVGACFTGLERVFCYPNALPDHRDPKSLRGIVVRGLESDVWVNAAGVRFHDESRRGGGAGTSALLDQTPARCWAIIDRRELDRVALGAPQYGLPSAPDRAEIDAFLAESPFVHRGETLEALARQVALPAPALTATVEAVNGWIRNGVDRDPVFGRPLGAMRRIETPPFIALEYFPLARKVLGGVRTDLSCRVLGVRGDPVPGLYAVGEVAGMAGGHINGRGALEGTMIGPSIFSGRVAGRAVRPSGIV